MATSPLGGFADLSSYRRSLDLQKANQLAADPLADLILSAQQGYALQQLPQTMMAQEQAKVDAALATQLKNALVAEQLNVLRNPEAARTARLQEDILKGLVAGTNPGLVLEPQIDPALVEARAVAEAAGGTPTTSYAGGDFIPLGTLPGGRRAGISPSAAAEATGRKNAARIAEIKARADAAGVPGTVIIDQDGNPQFIPTRATGGVAPTATQVLGPDGTPIKGQIKKGGATGLTPTRISIIAGKSGEAGFTQEDIDEKYTTNGVVDWIRVNIDANRKIQENVKEAARLKASVLPASLREKASGFIAAHGDLGELTVSLREFQTKGGEPGAWERAVGVALEQPPDGVWSALYQSVIGQSLTADTRELNALKARVRSAVTKANAGLSQTEREIANVTQYSPATNDTLEQTLQKAAGLESYIRNQVRAITVDPNEWLKTFGTATAVVPPPSSTVSGASPLDKLRQKYAR